MSRSAASRSARAHLGSLIHHPAFPQRPREDVVERITAGVHRRTHPRRRRWCRLRPSRRSDRADRLPDVGPAHSGTPRTFSRPRDDFIEFPHGGRLDHFEYNRPIFAEDHELRAGIEPQAPPNRFNRSRDKGSFSRPASRVVCAARRGLACSPICDSLPFWQTSPVSGCQALVELTRTRAGVLSLPSSAR